MAYENINFYEQNMAISKGYYYLLDVTKDVLIQKLSDGKTAFQYPLSISPTFTTYTLDTVICLHYDNFNFWSLQKLSDNTGIILRRWVIKNYLLSLEAQFPKLNTASRIYDVDTFAVENYSTVLSQDTLVGDNILMLRDYTESVIFSGTTLYIGPNKFMETEVVIVDYVDNTDIHLRTSLTKNFFFEDLVVITPTVFIFNNYTDLDPTKGSLIMLDSSDGTFISQSSNVEYSDITASKFCALKGVLPDYPNIQTLAYVKGTNFKLRNMADMYRYSADIGGSDNFTGVNGSLLGTSKWFTFSGNATIFNNKLFYSTAGVGSNRIDTVYNIVGDFEVQVSGTVGGFVTFSGTNYFQHYLRINSTNNYYGIRNIYSNYIDPVDGPKNKSSIENFVNDTVVESNNFVQGLEYSYLFNISKVGSNISCKYKTITSGTVVSDWVGLLDMPAEDTEYTLSLGLQAVLVTVSGSYFDDLNYISGYLRYPSIGTTYYGIMGMDNIRTDQSTYIPIYDIDIEDDNLFRLQVEANYYGTDNYWSTYNYQISPIRPFVDFITVDSDTHVLPATGRNTAKITSVSLDQYGNGIVNNPVTFTDDDSVGFITSTTVNTDIYFNTGKAETAYTSGTALRIVNINAKIYQED